MRNEQCGIPSLEYSNQLYTDSTDKANILKDHFSSVFTIDNFQSQPTPSGLFYRQISDSAHSMSSHWHTSPTYVRPILEYASI